MLVLPQKITIKWSSTNRKHYESKGYIFTKKGEDFEINVLDLSRYSSNKVEIICDYCNEKFLRRYDKFFNKLHNKKDSCKKCSSIKRKETNLSIYGCEHAILNESIKQDIKNKNLEKYGVEHFLQNKEIRKRIEETNIKKYGGKTPTASKEVMKKIEQTNLKKYGAKAPAQNKVIKDKIIKKYLKTFYKNGTGPSSIQQRYVCNLVKGELNYPIDKNSLDIAFLDEKIFIEYDGSGHDLKVQLGKITLQEHKKYEQNRFYFLKKLGWRQIRIISQKDLLPSDEVILEYVQLAKKYLNSGHSWFEIRIDENKIKCSQYEKEVDFGKLRRIKKDNI